MKKHNQAGFTLIEILVVIAIIAVLTVLGVSNYSTVRQRARDAKRQSDMKDIQKGFEFYYSDNGVYDNCATMGGSDVFPNGLPDDPQSPNSDYTGSCDASGYCYCAELEVSDDGNSTAPAGSTTCSFATTGTRDYFCVTNLQ